VWLTDGSVPNRRGARPLSANTRLPIGDVTSEVFLAYGLAHAAEVA
jgi:hypothetical protein